MNDTEITVAAVDDHPVVLSGIGAALTAADPGLRVLAVAESTDELLAGAGADADVVLLDLSMHRPDGQSAETDVRRITARGAVVLLFTSEGRPVPIRRAVAAGASGLVLKVDPIETIVATIRDSVSGELACSGAVAHALLTDASLVTRLSPRQVQILQEISEGLSYRAIARSLAISESTVREHLNRAVAAYRDRGIEAGNAHALVTAAREEGHLDRQ